MSCPAADSGEHCVDVVFLLCFSVTRLGPWCIDIALLFDAPVVHGCLFVACLVLFAWGLCIAALLCLVCLIVEGRFRTITCRQIRLAHSSVCQGSHTLAHPSDLRLGKGCKVHALEGLWIYGVTVNRLMLTVTIVTEAVVLHYFSRHHLEF